MKWIKHQNQNYLRRSAARQNWLVAANDLRNSLCVCVRDLLKPNNRKVFYVILRIFNSTELVEISEITYTFWLFGVDT